MQVITFNVGCEGTVLLCYVLLRSVLFHAHLLEVFVQAVIGEGE